MTGLTFAKEWPPPGLDVRDLVTRHETPEEKAAIKAYRYRRDVERHAPGCTCQYRGGDSCRKIRKRVPWQALDQ